MSEVKYDTATGVSVANDGSSVTFPCPKCGTEIVRSGQSRAICIKYTCPKCGFTGPN